MFNPDNQDQDYYGQSDAEREVETVELWAEMEAPDIDIDEPFPGYRDEFVLN